MIHSKDGHSATYESIRQGMHAVLKSANPLSVSLHQARGEVLWPIDTPLDLDDRAGIQAAVETFAKISGPALILIHQDLERTALLMRAVNEQRVTVGIVRVILEGPARQWNNRRARRFANRDLYQVLTEFALLCTRGASLPSIAESGP